MAKEPFRTNGLPGFAVSAENLKQVLDELRKLDPNLRKELTREMREAIKPIGRTLGAKIPAQPPLSGFAPAVGSSPYIWRKPTMSVRAPFGKRAKKPGFYPVVSIRFNDRRPNAGLSILELAGTANIGRDKKGLTPQGEAMIRNLNRVFPVKNGLGRFIIPEFPQQRAEATRVAVDILKKFAAKVNRRLRTN